VCVSVLNMSIKALITNKKIKALQFAKGPLFCLKKYPVIWLKLGRHKFVI